VPIPFIPHPLPAPTPSYKTFPPPSPSCPVPHHPNHQRYILGIQTNSFILTRLCFSQLEGDAVDGGCGLFFEVYFVGGHLDEYLGFRYGTYDEPCPL